MSINLIKSFSIVSLMCLVSHTALAQVRPIKNHSTPIATIHLNRIHTLQIGNHVNLHVNIKPQTNLLKTKDLNHLKIDAQAPHTLNISAISTAHASITLNQIPQHIKLTGNGTLTLKQYKQRSTPLVIDTRGPGHINLEGWFNIRRIESHSNSTIQAYWVHSKQININATNGSISIAGSTHHLLAKLSGNARLDAASLNSQHVWIDSTDQALAKTNPLNSLNAVARGHSQIAYLHQLPLSHIQRTCHDHANVVFVNHTAPLHRQSHQIPSKSHIVLRKHPIEKLKYF